MEGNGIAIREEVNLPTDEQWGFQLQQELLTFASLTFPPLAF